MKPATNASDLAARLLLGEMMVECATSEGAFFGRYSGETVRDWLPGLPLGIRVRIENSMNMTNWRKSEPKIWHWRICGRSSDSQIVTLGKYNTENEAQVDHDKIIKEGFYRNVRIEQIVTAHLPADLGIRP